MTEAQLDSIVVALYGASVTDDEWAAAEIIDNLSESQVREVLFRMTAESGVHLDRLAKLEGRPATEMLLARALRDNERS